MEKRGEVQVGRELMEQKDTERHWKESLEKLLSLGCTRCQTAVWAGNKPAAGAASGLSLHPVKETSRQELLPGTEGHFIMTEESVPEDDITILAADAPNNKAWKYMKNKETKSP